MTLVQLFTAIANAIRGKTGSSDSIYAEDFPTEIASIETGNLSDEEYAMADDDLDDILENTVVPSGTKTITANGTYDVTNYIEADVNIVSAFNAKVDTTKTYSYDLNVGVKCLITEVGNIDTSNLTNMTYFFAYCKNLKTIPLIDTSNVTSMNSMFSYCTDLESVPLLDTSKVTNGMSGMFSYCSSLTSLPAFNTSKLTNMNSMVQNCTSLTTIPVLDTGKVEYMNSTFSNCSALSNESLNNIMQMCINATTYTGTKTLRQIGLSSTQATTCQSLSNYSAFTTAGWTTGY